MAAEAQRTVRALEQRAERAEDAVRRLEHSLAAAVEVVPPP